MVVVTFGASKDVHSFIARYQVVQWFSRWSRRAPVFSHAPEPTLVRKYNHVKQLIITLTSY